MADSSLHIVDDVGGAETLTVTEPAKDTYEVQFGRGGHRFRLFDRPGTFRVSPAGLALGDWLANNLGAEEVNGRILDTGTGSGVIALLVRGMGATQVVATDISESAVSTAQDNELENFGDTSIDFRHCDLFAFGREGDQRQRFDLITFNPPGWRAPSAALREELDRHRCHLDLEAMFFGDVVMLRFLRQLPDFLAPSGRAIVGLNSLVGITDIIERSRSTDFRGDGPALQFRLLERIELPLLFYTDAWRDARGALLREFEAGREAYKADFLNAGDTINWFYEITEVTVERPLPAQHAVQSARS